MSSIRLLLLTFCLAATLPQVARAELYDDLGGAAGIQGIVDRVVPRWLADPRVGPTLADTNMTRFRRLLAEQLCQVSDGPCHYSGRDMAAAHRGLDLHQAQFNALTEDLQAAMDDQGVPYHVQNRLVARLAPMQRDVVTR